METSHQLFKIVEDGDVFNPIGSVNQGLEKGKFMSFEYLDDNMDGIFPRVSDWTRFANRIDNDGISEFLIWISKNPSRLIADFGYCTVQRESKWDSEATLTFKEPIKVSFGKVNGEHIIREVDTIKGEFTYEWGWYRTTGRQNKIANVVEVFFRCDEFFNYAENQIKAA